MSKVRTTCPYCGVGCGVIVEMDEAGRVDVAPDPAHPSNLGRLCSKGAALADTLSMEGRLLYPEVMGTTCDWNMALDFVARELGRIVDESGPDAVAFYVSGQLLTEDYYVANKLMKGYIGSANIDTNSRLCMSSAVAAHKRAFGSDTVPCSYEDLERAKLIVLTGSNTAWCHPVLYQRIVQAKRENPDIQVVVIDPRRTATCDIADLYLQIRPGTDAWLFNGLLGYLQRSGEVNRLFVQQYTRGAEEALSAAQDCGSVSDIATACGLDEQQLTAFFRLFARTERVMTLFSQGVNQSTTGTDKINAIINCHLLSGRIGRPGMGPFSLTGQPNAMGGREVGGLANQLAAHMDIENPEHRRLVQAFWGSPAVPETVGLKAVDMFQAMRDGRIRAVWIMGTNPAVSMPDSNRIREALQACELVIVSDCMRQTDTTVHASVLLPAQTWGERDGTVTNSERRISRQRSVLPVPGEARPDWWIISEVARRMGFAEGFPYQAPVEIFREHARLSAYRNDGTRDFDIGAFADIDQQHYDALEPVQWPVTRQHSQGTPRMFEDGRFFTDDGRARLVAITPRLPDVVCDEPYPLLLNTGRVRDHWHTMTRTGKSARLSAHIMEPFASIHPDDASRTGVVDGGLVRLCSPTGDVIVRARVTDSQQPGEVFGPMHWNDQFASRAVINRLVTTKTDPHSGQPQFKHNAVRIEPFEAQWYGFLLSRRHLRLQNAVYWSHSRGKGYWRYEIAGDDMPDDWASCARSLLCTHDDDVGWIEYFDRAARRYRAARLVNGCLESCVFIGPDITLPPRDYLARLFDAGQLDDAERASLLSGRPVRPQADTGPIVCACFNIGLNTIAEAIRRQGLDSVEAIGQTLKAGTNCGSCIPEIRRILEANKT